MTGGFRSGSTTKPGSYSYQFNQIGTFYYICEPHAAVGMKGGISLYFFITYL